MSLTDKKRIKGENVSLYTVKYHKNVKLKIQGILLARQRKLFSVTHPYHPPSVEEIFNSKLVFLFCGNSFFLRLQAKLREFSHKCMWRILNIYIRYSTGRCRMNNLKAMNLQLTHR